MPPPKLIPIVLADLLPNDDVVQGQLPLIQCAVRQLLVVEPGLYDVARGRAPTRDEVAALHTTCHAIIFTRSQEVPAVLRAMVARWLEAATREVGRPTPDRVSGESVMLAQELLAFAAPIAPPAFSTAATLSKVIRELDELLVHAGGASNALERLQ